MKKFLMVLGMFFLVNAEIKQKLELNYFGSGFSTEKAIFSISLVKNKNSTIIFPMMVPNKQKVPPTWYFVIQTNF